MKVWVVSESDYDNTWIVAVYASADLAAEHERLMGGYIEEQEVRLELHPDAIDPARQAERHAKDERAREETRKYREYWQHHAAQVRDMRPRPPHMSLCHCETFSKTKGPGALIPWTEHGYCSYCGGWSPAVFKEHMGEAALQSKIADLAAHDREKMRQIVASL